MAGNIFLDDIKQISFEEYLTFDENCRGNLGGDIPVMIYRMLEYSLKDELRERYGKETQIDIFRSAGRKAGDYFVRHFLDTSLPLDQFISELQMKLQEFKIGVMRVEDVDIATGKITLTVSEDADCSGLPVLGETVCNYDEGFIAGIFSYYTGKSYSAIEVDCWATGDRVCRFCAEVKE